MNRRHFIFRAGIGATGFALAGRSVSAMEREMVSRASRAQSEPTDNWRTFEITTQVDVRHASPTTRAWLPTPLAVAPYQKTFGDTYHAAGRL